MAIIHKWWNLATNKIMHWNREKTWENIETGNWTVTVDEFCDWMRILYDWDISGTKETDIHYFLSIIQGLNFCIETMRRNRFWDILRFLRFNLRYTRFKPLREDKYGMVCNIWNISLPKTK